MKARKFIWLFLIVAFFPDCRSKVFRNIEVEGRLLHFYSKEPIAGQKISLYIDNVHSASNYATAEIPINETTTSIDGTFKLKGNASKNKLYYLRYQGHEQRVNSTDTLFQASPGAFVNVGDLFMGEQLLRYQVRYRSINVNCAWIPVLNDPKQSLFVLEKGRDTTIQYTILYDYRQFFLSKGQLSLYSKIGPCSGPVPASKGFSVAITHQDTMQIQIDY